MLTKVKITAGQVVKNQEGKDTLDLRVVDLNTGEPKQCFGFKPEYVTMWNDNIIPQTLTLDLDELTAADGRKFLAIKDMVFNVPPAPEEELPFVQAPDTPPEPMAPHDPPSDTGPTRDDLFGGGSHQPPQQQETAAQPAQQETHRRPPPPARRESQSQVPAIYEKSQALLQQPSFLEHAESIVPQGKSASRLIQVAGAAFMQNPQLLDCHPQSLLNCVLSAVSLGLEVNTPLGEAYIVPFNSRNGKVAQFIPGYRGMVELMTRSGRVSHVQAFTVCANDEFDWLVGQIPTHRRAKENRGDVVGAWALVTMVNGRQAADYMDASEINAIRDKSPGYKQSDSPWKTHYAEMARKTVVRRIAKMMPKSGGVQKALDFDEREDDFEDQPVWVVEEDQPAEVLPQGTNAGGSVGAAKATDFAPAGASDTEIEDLFGGPRYSSTGLLVQQTGPTTADVQSQSDESKWYGCDFIAYTCLCPDARYRFDQRAGGCKHIIAAREVVGDDNLVAAIKGGWTN